MCATSLAYLFRIDIITLTAYGKEQVPYSSSLRSFFQPLVVFSLIGMYICSMFILCPSIGEWDQVPFPDKTRGKIILLLTFMVVYRRARGSELNVSMHSPYLIGF
jgi:hypothetical protein